MSCTRRSEYAAENSPPSVASAPTHHEAPPQKPLSPACSASCSIISLLMKPLKGGSPAMAALATSTRPPTTGIDAISPPRRRMSRVPVSWSTMPALMNSAALKAAWFRMWNTAATADSGDDSPIRKVISPRWLTVE